MTLTPPAFNPLHQTGLDINSFIELSPIAVLRVDDEGVIIEANNAFRTLCQQPLIENVRLVDLIESEDKTRLTDAIERTWRVPGAAQALSLSIHAPSGQAVSVFTYITLMQPPDTGRKPIMILHMIDQTEQKNLEMRFAHSQKMQAVGQLAGGVAHDFNNLLTAMIGFCDLLLMRHPAGDPSFADIMQIKQNANRAANLVRQLLAFSRRQTLQPKIIDLSDLLAELSNLIRRLIGENIQLRMVHGRELGAVKADQGQLEQVIINLAVNARDAMKEGGALTIRTSNITIHSERDIDRDYTSPTEEEQILPGEYVLVEVEDTGTGIQPEILKNIFEPFFSTKEVGSGTGLGLSTCYGIIKQTGGYIYVKSKQGEGTSFSLFFRRHQAEQPASKPIELGDDAKATDLTGKATILLVEDETPVRIFAARALRNKGYEVIEADNGDTAIEAFSQHSGVIDLIITDVVMPGMNGPKMVQALEQREPERMKDIKVIFISGYAEDAFIDTFGPSREFNFLPKPFTLKQLAGKVKEVVDGIVIPSSE